MSVEIVDGGINATTAIDFAHVTGTTVDVSNYTLNSTSGWFGNKYVLTVDIPADAAISFTPDMVRLRFTNDTTAASQSLELSNVQCEFGDTPTVFEYEPEHITLDKCLRYLYVLNVISGAFIGPHAAFSKSGSLLRANVFLPKPMRVFPSYTGTATDALFYAQNSGSVFHLDSLASMFNNGSADRNITNFGIGVTTGSMSSGQGGQIEGQETGTMIFDAEL